MSLRIYAIPSGNTIQVPPPIPTSVEELRAWIEQAFNIPEKDQILLSGKAKPIKIQDFFTEPDIFLYDRLLFSHPSKALHNISLESPLSFSTPDPFPDTLADQKSLKSWQTLFGARRDWAQDILGECKVLQRIAEDLLAQRSVIQHGVRLAVLSIEPSVKQLTKKLAEIQTGLTDTSRETALKANNLQDDLLKLSEIPALSSFRPLLLHTSEANLRLGKIESTAITKPGRTATTTTLSDFVSPDAAHDAVSQTREIFARFNAHMTQHETAIKNLDVQVEQLKRGLDNVNNRSIIDHIADNNEANEPQKLVAEIQAVANKVFNDCDMIFSLKNEAKSLSQASRVALLHTKNLLPGLTEYVKEMSQLLMNIVEQKNASLVRAVDILSMVVGIEAQYTTLRDSLNTLRMAEKDWAIVDQLTIVSEMPNLYGSLLIEAIRRYEWIDKMKKDSVNLAEEIAGYREEEQRRRKKWIRGMKDIVPHNLDGPVLALDINFRDEEGGWPVASRKDLDDYLAALQTVPGMTDALEFLADMVRELDKPTRQQVKRANIYKNSSIHEAAGFAKGSLLMRGEDEGLVLKEVILKLEEELKSHKSRVRKLEDVLHRQNHLGRVSNTITASPLYNGPQEAAVPEASLDRPHSRNAQSPRRFDCASRMLSGTTRRLSNQIEDKISARHIVQLEAQSAEDRRLRAGLEKELRLKGEETQTIWGQLEEANSTKKDIMDNMDAQQKEFATERKQLELKVEELEEELDRVLGSRDNERISSEKRIDEVTAELEQTRKDHSSKLHEYKDQVEDGHIQTLRRDAETQKLLANLYATLSPTHQPPMELDALMAELEGVARRSVDQATHLAHSMALACTDKDRLQTAIDSHRADITALSIKLHLREAEMLEVNGQLVAEQAKAAALSAQLKDERTRSSQLDHKCDSAESDSEPLSRRLGEEELRVKELSGKLGEASSHISSLNAALLSLESKYKSLQSASQVAMNKSNEREQRVKEVTRRFCRQIDELFSLLETLGFAASFNKDSMVIQRASKVGASSLLTDQSTTCDMTAPIPAKTLLEDLSSLSSRLWTGKGEVGDADQEEGERFSEFIGKIDGLKMETICDSIAKRMRDVEHTARKWQREARAYRDKSRKLQTDAHDKLAYRLFKEGDLALFLPTRNQASRPWAAFNVGAPHYFLREQDSHRLANKEWLVARITRIEERTVDLSRTMNSDWANTTDGSVGDISEGGVTFEDDNPFNLGDGLRWYLLDAQEETAGAPSTPGLGKTTVAAANVDAAGSIRISKKNLANHDDEVARQLSMSLESCRSSSTSKQNANGSGGGGLLKSLLGDGLHDTSSTGSSNIPQRGWMPSHLRSNSSAASSLRKAENCSHDVEAGVGARPLAQEQQRSDQAQSVTHEDRISRRHNKEQAEGQEHENDNQNQHESINTNYNNNIVNDKLPPKPTSTISLAAEPPAPCTPLSSSSSASSTSPATRSIRQHGKSHSKAAQRGKAVTTTSTSTRARLWDSLWHFDLSIESGQSKKQQGGE